MLRVKNLEKIIDTKKVLNGVTFSVAPGIIFGFLGPNGAGKSTTLNVITGVLTPTSGDIIVCGYDYNEDTNRIKQEIGVVPETLGLFESLTGAEHLEFVGRIYEISICEIRSRINELMELFELTSAARNIIDTYSHGMKKKLSFASAIMHTPKLLFLDEPFENIDPHSQRKMKLIIQRMKNSGCTIFLTSHNLAMVEDLCDEVAIIDRGKIVFQSETKELRNKIKNEVTKETYQSLEEIFLDLTTEKEDKDKMPTWL